MKWDFKPKELDFYGEGFEFIPLHKPGAKDKKGKPVGKSPIGRWRRQRASTLAEAVELMAEQGHNVGVRLRDVDLVIDVDPRNFDDGTDPLEQLQADLGVRFDDAPTVITGSGGKHIYLRKPHDAEVRDSLGEAYKGIEFKSLGRQVVAAGSVHPDTKQPYLFDPLSMPMPMRPTAPRALLEVIKPAGRMATAEAGKFQDKVEELEELLNLIDASEYGRGRHTEWLNLAMSYHFATAGHGRAEFVAWCMTDPDYYKEAANVGRRWDSFSVDGYDPKGVRKRPITHATFFKAAIKADEAAARRIIDVIDPRDPSADFPKYDDDEVEKAELDAIIASLPDGSRSVSEALEWFNKEGYCCVKEVGGGGFRIVKQEIDYEWSFLGTDGEEQKRRMRWGTYRTQDFLTYYKPKRCQSADGKRTLSLAEEWLAYPGRRSYETMIFDPACRDKSGRTLNLWTDWAVQPKKGDCSLLYELLREALCDGDEEHYQYCLKWAAFMVQNPDQQAEVAVVFRGEKGTGKGTWFRALMSLCGRHAIQITNPQQFTGHFNAHLRDCVFLFVDEAYATNDRKSEGALKGLVTEPQIALEAKGKDIIRVRNNLHIGMASNADWVVPASSDDERRFAVFDVNNKYRGNMQFFERLNKQLKNGGLSALLWDLKVMDLTGFHPRRGVPKTNALIRQKIASFDTLDAWWFNCLVNRSMGPGVHPVAGDWNQPGTYSRFFSMDLQDSFEQYLQKTGDRSRLRRSDMTKIGAHLKRRVPRARHARFMVAQDRRMELDGWMSADGRTYGYDLPSVDDCRSAFEHQIGGALPWDRDAMDVEIVDDLSSEFLAEVVDELDPLDPLA